MNLKLIHSAKAKYKMMHYLKIKIQNNLTARCQNKETKQNRLNNKVKRAFYQQIEDLVNIRNLIIGFGWAVKQISKNNKELFAIISQEEKNTIWY